MNTQTHNILITFIISVALAITSIIISHHYNDRVKTAMKEGYEEKTDTGTSVILWQKTKVE